MSRKVTLVSNDEYGEGGNDPKKEGWNLVSRKVTFESNDEHGEGGNDPKNEEGLARSQFGFWRPSCNALDSTRYL